MKITKKSLVIFFAIFYILLVILYQYNPSVALFMAAKSLYVLGIFAMIYIAVLINRRK